MAQKHDKKAKQSEQPKKQANSAKEKQSAELSESDLDKVSGGIKRAAEVPDIITGAGPGAPGGHVR